MFGRQFAQLLVQHKYALLVHIPHPSDIAFGNAFGDNPLGIDVHTSERTHQQGRLVVQCAAPYTHVEHLVAINGTQTIRGNVHHHIALALVKQGVHS